MSFACIPLDRRRKTKKCKNRKINEEDGQAARMVETYFIPDLAKA
jgi:hypothetical protein